MKGSKRSRSKTHRGDYKVGYGKPPKPTCFKPGQSGNPNGRPKGTPNFKTHVKSTLKAPVKLTRDGESHNVSTQEAMLLRLRAKALDGDGRALDRLISLAQVYGDDELAPTATLSADDEHVLAIYRARLLGNLTPISPSDEAPVANDDPSNSAASAGTHQSKPKKIKRVRSKTRTRPDD